MIPGLAVLAWASLSLIQAPGAQAGAGNSTPILVVHGFDAPDFNSGMDCRDEVMRTWVRRLRERGFTDVRTVGWYQNDINCSMRVPGVSNNTVNTSYSQIARELTNLISQRFGGQEVAIAAHSAGGLIARRALDGVQNRHDGFSHDIRVTTVVTAGTPHAGTPWADACGEVQCREMRRGSAFLGALANNPQTTGSTRWTLIGSDCDEVVPSGSATTMSRVSRNRPAIFSRVFAPRSFCSGGFFHNDLVKQNLPLDAMVDGLRGRSPTGVASLSPAETTLEVGQRVTYEYAWEVPAPLAWKALDWMDLRLRDALGVAFWVRWDEETDSFALVDPVTGEPAGVPLEAGGEGILTTGSARLDVSAARVVGSGPTGRTVTLRLPIEVLSPANGRTLMAEVTAQGDRLEQPDAWAQLGTVDLSFEGRPATQPALSKGPSRTPLAVGSSAGVLILGATALAIRRRRR